MRVLHITTEYPPVVYGGLGTAVGGLVDASSRAGLDVAVLLVGAGTSAAYTGSSQSADPSTVRVPLRRGFLLHPVPHEGAAAAAVRFARRWRPDVLHVHVFWLTHVATAIREAIGTPIVYTVHSLDRAEYEIGDGPPECVGQWQTQSALIHTADRIVALTVDESRLISTYCADVSPRIRIVGNGIADSAAASAAAARVHDPATVTILYAGRFVERKGLRELLMAAPGVLEQFPHARLVLAGGHRHCSGAEMAQQWLPSACRPFVDRLTFTGWLNAQELDNWYATADVLVVPSWYEPFGMVILEGMLHGLAIIAADVGGPSAILTHNVTGVLCKPRDAVSLEQALVRVVSDRRLRKRLGRRAARAVRELWLHDRIVPRIQAVYGELIGECVQTTAYAMG